jgi:outer membrane protein
MSDSIQIQREITIQSDETRTQALGAMLPTINGTGTYLRQASPTSATGAAISPAEQETAKITLTQPLFEGLRDFAALRQTKDLQGVQYFTLLNAAKQLFYDVSTAYYNVLAYQQDERNYFVEILDSEKRLSDLNEFYKIGRSQLTDVLTFKSSIASLKNQLEMVRGQLAVAKEVLAYNTGWSADFVLKDNEVVTVELGELNKYLDKIELRPDVQSALASAQAYEEGISVAFGNHLPTVNLTADYFLTRPGALKDVNWDAQVLLTMPIFQGGVVQSQVRAAHSVARQYSALLSQTRRQAVQEVRTFYAQLSADQKQVKRLEELVNISKENFETEIKYFKNGLVTNLEVLQSMTTYEDATRLLDHQRFSVQLDRAKLEAATGLRDEINIPPPSGDMPEMKIQTSITSKG